MSHKQIQNYKMTEAHTYREIERNLRKTHKTKCHINFLETCLFKNCLPKFTLLMPQTIRRLSLNKSQVTKHRQNILIDALNEHNSNLVFLSQTYQKLFDTLKTFNPDFKKIIAILQSRIIKSESHTDQKRAKKLENLINFNNKSDNEPSIEIFDYSTKKLPENIKSILKHGLQNEKGGYNKKILFWLNLNLSSRLGKLTRNKKN